MNGSTIKIFFTNSKEIKMINNSNMKYSQRRGSHNCEIFSHSKNTLNFVKIHNVIMLVVNLFC